MDLFTEKRFLPKRTVGRDEKERLAAVIAESLSKKAEIVFSYLHGSFVTDEPFRDIDVAIYVWRGESFELESDLSHELSMITGQEVEVKIINRAPVAFQMAPLQHGKLLFSKDEDLRADFLETVGKNYREYAHFRNIFMEAVGAEH